MLAQKNGLNLPNIRFFRDQSISNCERTRSCILSAGNSPTINSNFPRKFNMGTRTIRIRFRFYNIRNKRLCLHVKLRRKGKGTKILSPSLAKSSPFQKQSSKHATGTDAQHAPFSERGVILSWPPPSTISSWGLPLSLFRLEVELTVFDVSVWIRVVCRCFAGEGSWRIASYMSFVCLRPCPMRLLGFNRVYGRVAVFTCLGELMCASRNESARVHEGF